MTRYSRSESFSCSAFCGSLEHSEARISASCALTYLPPFATLRTAVLSSVGALSLVMYPEPPARKDRKSTRLNSSHRCISYAVFCLKKKRVFTKLPLQRHMEEQRIC